MNRTLRPVDGRWAPCASYRAHGFAVLALLVAAAALVGALPSSGAPADPCGAGSNEIVCENSKPGSPPSEWDVSGSGDASIQGFATDISVDQGQTVSFKVTTTASSYAIDIYRLGWYGGNGARKVATVLPSAPLPQSQPSCLTDSTGLVDCGNWAVSASWQVPADAVSGVYVARPKRADTGGASHIVFVVRDDDGASDVLLQTADTTWQAYNRYGGNSLYTGTHSAQGIPAGRAYKVSYNRPFTNRAYESKNWVFSTEYPLIRFLERNGYDVSYFTGTDAQRLGPELLEHPLYMTAGHDEYWSAGQRANVEAARNAGVNLAFMSGNDIYWKTRWESSIAPGAAPTRTLVCYKETSNTGRIDPTGTWTGEWRNPFGSPPADGGRPENELTGTLFEVQTTNDLRVPAADGKLRFWRNTTVANLAPGTQATFTGLLGYEWNEAVDNAVRPPGLFYLSTSTHNVSFHLDRRGPAQATHHMTTYKHGSGALVFSAGFITWGWVLDSTHDPDPGPAMSADVRWQQATVNLLADLDAQPVSLMAGLVGAAKSIDSGAPEVSVTSAPPSFTAGSPVTIAGTAIDTGGGIVAGVEVSVDGGGTWHPAAGRESWTYTFTPQTTGPATVLARAVDDSGNLSGRELSMCPCTIWGDATPETASVDVASAYELGVKFRSDEAGAITAIRFYKGPQNTGTHVGHLWTASGTLLATATFTSETATGWQQASFPSPVAIGANTTYVVSYFAPSGGFAVDRPYFSPAGKDEPPLHALADGVDGPNGVYAQGSGFPTQTYNASNYWVDVVFESSGVDRNPPSVVAKTPAPGAAGVAAFANVTARFDENVAPATVNGSTFRLRDGAGAIVPAAVTYDAATTTATLDPDSSLAVAATYTVTVVGGTGGVADLAGNTLASDVTWSFTTASPSSCPCTIFGSATPTTASLAIGGAYELGVKFRSDADGFVTAIRFYKGSANTGTHVGRLWTAGGTLLASTVFFSESASGWQQATLATPVAVTAGTTYVASYSVPNGGFALDRPAFSPTGVDAPPLHVLADGFAGPNGVYALGTGNFPVQGVSASNYWVDLVFDTGATDTTPPVVVSTTPAAGATGVVGSAQITVRFNEAMTTSTITAATVRLRDSSGAAVTAAVAYDDATRSATLTPASALAAGTYTATVAGGTGGVADMTGNTLAADHVWSFTVAAATSCPCTIWSPSATPATASVAVTTAYELGVRFRSDQDGFITGIRFYKGAANTGTHVGHLWTAGGSLLGTVTFTGETASGWQEASFGAPVMISAATSYVASYTVPNGGFSLDRPGLATSVDRAPLHAPADAANAPNGVYAQGTGFPTATYASSNYWVDVVFDTAAADVRAPVVASVAPADGATGVSTSTAISATFNEAMSAGSIGASTFVLETAASAPVAATVAYNAGSRTATLTPAVALGASATYTARVRGGTGGVADTSGNPLAADRVWSFTVAAPTACPCSIWSASTVPAIASIDVGSAYELGVKFRSDRDGFVTGVRFYKGSGNTGTHVGRLWTAGGAQLAQVTFTGETATGWQYAAFSSPVAITADTTYVASYSDPNGHFALDRPGLATAVDNAPLRALADGAAGGNGVYGIGVGSFPAATYEASNYWVDVSFSLQ